MLGIPSTDVDKFEIQQLPGNPFLDYSGTVSLPLSAIPTVPKFRALTTLGYQVGPMNVGVRWQYVASMDDVTVVTRPASPAPGVPSYNLFDLLLGYRFSDGVSVNAQVTNQETRNLRSSRPHRAMPIAACTTCSVVLFCSTCNSNCSNPDVPAGRVPSGIEH